MTCGACTFIAADHVDGENIAYNMAYSGALVLSTLDATAGTGRVMGSLTNAKFKEITIDANGQTTVVGGCRSIVAGVTFDFTVEAGP